MTAVLQKLIAALYEGRPVPPAEGGLFFRTVCEERRRVGDLYWTEGRIQDLARELGLWPWSFRQVETALRQSREAVPVSEAGYPVSATDFPLRLC